jgi:hypothetical protein
MHPERTAVLHLKNVVHNDNHLCVVTNFVKLAYCSSI